MGEKGGDEGEGEGEEERGRKSGEGGVEGEEYLLFFTNPLGSL